MSLTQKGKQRSLKQFHSYAWRVIKNELKNDAKENQRRLNREISMTNLTMELCAAQDRYFVESYKIDVYGISIELDDAELAIAIQALEQKYQAIITFYYVMNLSDRIIADMLELHVSSVRRARIKALKQLRTYLEECNYGQ